MAKSKAWIFWSIGILLALIMGGIIGAMFFGKTIVNQNTCQNTGCSGLVDMKYDVRNPATQRSGSMVEFTSGIDSWTLNVEQLCGGAWSGKQYIKSISATPMGDGARYKFVGYCDLWNS